MTLFVWSRLYSSHNIKCSSKRKYPKYLLVYLFLTSECHFFFSIRNKNLITSWELRVLENGRRPRWIAQSFTIRLMSENDLNMAGPWAPWVTKCLIFRNWDLSPWYRRETLQTIWKLSFLIQNYCLWVLWVSLLVMENSSFTRPMPAPTPTTGNNQKLCTKSVFKLPGLELGWGKYKVQNLGVPGTNSEKSHSNAVFLKLKICAKTPWWTKCQNFK